MASKRQIKRRLFPFFTESEVNSALTNYIPTQCQNIPPLLEYEDTHNQAFVTKQALLPFFMNKPLVEDEKDKYYIILADAGMGKTTFMLNLYNEYLKKYQDPDIEVDFKPLTYPNTVSDVENMPEEEVEKTKPKTYYSTTVRMFPLGYPNVLDEVLKIPLVDRMSTILLLDALDEDPQAIYNHHQRLENILEAVKDFREVIITCRTQFFPDYEENPGETGILRFMTPSGKEYNFHKFYISPFDEQDIKKYIRKNYPFYNYFKRKKAEKIVQKVPNLMMRPMILSYMEDLIKENYRYEYTFQVYEDLIEKWADRESRKVHYDKAEFEESLYHFSSEVAVNMYDNRHERKGWFIPEDELVPFAKKHNIQLVELELKSRALLNLNAQGHYKFAHKSILEYFLARETFYNAEFGEKLAWKELELTSKFLQEMYIRYARGLRAEFQTSENYSFEFQDIAKLSVEDIPNVVALKMNRIHQHDFLTIRGFEKLQKLVIGELTLSGETLDELLNQKKLNLSNRQLSNIDFLENFIHLEHLDLQGNNLDSVYHLRQLIGLRYLDLSYNNLEDVSILQSLHNLESLNLSNNQIRNIYSLKESEDLEKLIITHNQIHDIEFLHTLPKLRFLEASHNKVPDEQLADFSENTVVVI